MRKTQISQKVIREPTFFFKLLKSTSKLQ